MATTTIEPRQMTRKKFQGSCRTWAVKGLGWAAVAELLPPSCRPTGMSVDQMQCAFETIASAIEVEDAVSNPRMVQAHRDFVNYERRAQEEAHLYAGRCGHVEKAYLDEPIRVAKREVLDASKNKYRELADQAAADWQSIQQRRILLDTAAAEFPEAFRDFIPWQPA